MTTRVFSWAACALLLGFAYFSVAAANAQTPLKPHNAAPAAGHAAEVPDRSLTQDEINALVARLSDAEVRRVLIEQLQRMSGEPAKTGKTAHTSADSDQGALGQLEATANDMRQNLLEALGAIRDLSALPGWLLERMSTGESAGRSFAVFALTLLAIGLGIAAEWLLWRWTAVIRTRLESEMTEPPLNFGLWLARASLDLLLVIGFGLVSVGALFAVYQGQLASRRAALVAIAAMVLLQLVRRLLRLALVPPPRMPRLLPLDDAAARAVLSLVLRSVFIAVIGYFAAGLLDSLGLPEPTARLFRLLIPTAVMAMLVVAIWRGRVEVATRLKAHAGPDRRVMQHLAEFWYVPALIYTLLVWLLWALNVLAGGSKQIGAGVVTLLIVLLYPTLVRTFSALLLRLVGTVNADGGRTLPQSIVIGQHLVLLAAAIMILAGTWGVPLLELFDTPIGHEVGRAALHIAVAVVLAFAAWEFFERLMLRHVSPREVDGATVAASARLRTLLPLFRIFVAIGLVTIATMVVLSSIGVDIGPMLAGAGVVGLAIGFGTQTLVRDVVSGILFMLEDAFRVGDYVEVDRMRGTVEAISLRSMRLRHHRGPVHTLPYGQIRSLTNYTRDWVIDKIEITVPHGTDVELVRKLLKRIGQELSEDPEIGPKIIEPLKSQGIAKITDAGLVIRIKFTALPRENFVVRRKALSRIVEVFHENGIELGQTRQVEVRLHSGEDDARAAEITGTSDPVEAAAVIGALPATGTSGAQ